MRKAWLLGILLAVFPVIVQAQNILSVSAKDKSLSAKGIVAYGGPVVQTDLSFNLSSILSALPKCLSGDVRWSKSADSRNFSDGFGNEIDLTADCAGKMGDFDADAGLAIFHLAPLFDKKEKVGDILQPFLNISRDFHLLEHHTIAPYVRAEVVLTVGWSHAKSGALLYAGISHQWDLHERITLNHRAAFVYDTGALVNFDYGLMVRYDASIGWNITRAIRLDLPVIRLMSPITIHDRRQTEYTIGAGVTLRSQVSSDQKNL